jgi:hypothetical protein
MEQTNHYVYGYRRSGLGFQWTYIIKEIKNVFVFHIDVLVCVYGYHVSMVNVVFITKRPVGSTPSMNSVRTMLRRSPPTVQRIIILIPFQGGEKGLLSQFLFMQVSRQCPFNLMAP